MEHAELTDELEELASLYAMGALPESEEAEYTRHLDEEHCAVCLTAVRDFQSVAALLAYIVPRANPSPALKERVVEAASNTAPR
jgi:hypothetical protein